MIFMKKNERRVVRRSRVERDREDDFRNGAVVSDIVVFLGTFLSSRR